MAQGLVEPRIREKGDFVDVEFYRPGCATSEEVTNSSGSAADHRRIPADTGGSPADTRASQENTVMRHLDTHAAITAKTVGELLAVKESRAREILKAMTDKGLLEKLGRARSTYYVRVKE